MLLPEVDARVFGIKLRVHRLFHSTFFGDVQPLVHSPRNSARYARYVKLVQALDAERVVAIYVHFYPLFQQAFVELGYPNAQFNDRLVDVIDHLLETPDVQGPVALVRPKVFFEFADPELEELSAGQKLMVRIGPDNAAVLKTKLREIRRALVAEAPA